MDAFNLRKQKNVIRKYLLRAVLNSGTFVQVSACNKRNAPFRVRTLSINRVKTQQKQVRSTS